MNTNGNGHALLAAGEGEVLEAGANRLVIKVASPSQLLIDYTARQSISIPASTRPS